MKNSNQNQSAWDNLPSVFTTPQQRYETARRDLMLATDEAFAAIDGPAVDFADAYIGLPSHEARIQQEAARLSATPRGKGVLHLLEFARMELEISRRGV